MKVKKFIGATVKAALAQVKERLGAEAVILANRATPEGIEVLAVAGDDMSDITQTSERDLAAAEPPPGFNASFKRAKEPERDALSAAFAPDEAPAPAAAPTPVPAAPEATRMPSLSREELAALEAKVEAMGETRRETAPATVASAPNGPKALDFVDFLRQAGREQVVNPSGREPRQSASAPRAPQAASGAGAQPPVAAGTKPRAEIAPASVSLGAPSAEALAGELRALRGLMEDRFAAMTLAGDLRRRPLAASLMRELLAAGFSTTLARAAVNALDADTTPQRARDWLHSKLVAQLRVARTEDDIVETGGVYALTGPTGVGKTTTTAKLAARCAVKHGATSLGLISTDTFRIGAQDQLRVFGKILGVPVHAVHDALGLEQTLAQMQDKHLVLIDTIGLGQRDERVPEGVAMLEACGVRRLVLLSATSQVETLEDVIDAYAAVRTAAAPAAGVIVTKIDEAAKLGGVVDVLLRHKLWLQFIGNGQRVPEDLHLPDAEALVRRALHVPRGGPFALSRDEAALLATAAGQELVFTKFSSEAAHA